MIPSLSSCYLCVCLLLLVCSGLIQIQSGSVVKEAKSTPYLLIHANPGSIVAGNKTEIIILCQFCLPSQTTVSIKASNGDLIATKIPIDQNSVYYTYPIRDPVQTITITATCDQDPSLTYSIPLVILPPGAMLTIIKPSSNQIIGKGAPFEIDFVCDHCDYVKTMSVYCVVDEYAYNSLVARDIPVNDSGIKVYLPSDAPISKLCGSAYLNFSLDQVPDAEFLVSVNIQQ